MCAERKVTEIIIVERDTSADLGEAATGLLREGWQPFHSAYYAEGKHRLLMVRYEGARYVIPRSDR